jgi:hypothetical protein
MQVAKYLQIGYFGFALGKPRYPWISLDTRGLRTWRRRVVPFSSHRAVAADGDRNTSPARDPSWQGATGV